MCLIWLLNHIPLKYTCLIKISASQKMDTKKTCLKEIWLCAQNMISILSSIVNIIGGTYMMNNEQKNLHFDSESGYGLDFNLLTIS